MSATTITATIEGAKMRKCQVVKGGNGGNVETRGCGAVYRGKHEGGEDATRRRWREEGEQWDIDIYKKQGSDQIRP